MANDYLIDKNIDFNPLTENIIIVKDYDPDYCRLIIEHCLNGGSVESFSGKEFIDPDVLAGWAKTYEDFKAAAKIAIAAEYRYWEKQLQEVFGSPDLAYRLISINRRLSELGNVLMKNGLRRSMYNNFDDSPAMTGEEKAASIARNNFIEE